jgi:predicted ATPase
MTSDFITLDGVDTEIETAPLTLLFHQGDVQIEARNRCQVDPETTLEACKEMSEYDWHKIRESKQFKDMFKKVFFDMEPPEFIHSEGLGVRHVVGMIVLIKLAQHHNVPVFIRYPESYLHPRYQLGLGDLLSSLSN